MILVGSDPNYGVGSGGEYTSVGLRIVRHCLVRTDRLLGSMFSFPFVMEKRTGQAVQWKNISERYLASPFCEWGRYELISVEGER